MHEIVFCLLAFSLAAARLEIGGRGRSGWPASMRIGLAVCVHDAEIVFRMLIKIFSRDPVAACCRLTRERNVAFEHLVRVTTDLYVRSIAVKSLDPMRHPRTIMMRVVAVVATARAFVWSWSHDTCLIAVDIIGPLSGRSIPLAPLGWFQVGITALYRGHLAPKRCQPSRDRSAFQPFSVFACDAARDARSRIERYRQDPSRCRPRAGRYSSLRWLQCPPDRPRFP